MTNWVKILHFFGKRPKQTVDSITTIAEVFDHDDTTATQKDKPSAGSSLTKTKAKYLLEKGAARAYHSNEYTTFEVKNTNSMEPFIDQNTIILVEKLKDNPHLLQRQPITVGDMCVYETVWQGQKVFMFHRIHGKGTRTGIDEPVYTFKGDNNFRRDSGYVKESSILYRYVGQMQFQKQNQED